MKAPTFSEKRFRERFFKTLQENGANDALTYFLDEAPAMLASKINRQEKLNYLLFLSRVIQGEGITKHGVAKIARKSGRMWRTWKQWSQTEPGTFIDIGCGAHDPIGMSTVMYGAGFPRALAVDHAAPRVPAFTALSFVDVLGMLRLRPDKYLPEGVDAERFFERLQDFDLDQMEAGNFFEGLAPMKGRVDYDVNDIVDADVKPGEASMIVSYAVFEHVEDIPSTLEFLYSRTAPGGIGFHFIDLRDHRAYRRTGEYNPFSFLTEEDGPDGVNRWRASEQLAGFGDAGFEVLDTIRIKETVPDEIRANLSPRFADLSQEDLETAAITLIVRRPP